MIRKIASSLALGVLVFACHVARAAVMTTNVSVSGAGPYSISYVLAQDAATLKANIYTAAGSLIASLDKSGDANYTGKGPHDTSGATGHLPAIEWDGTKQDGSAAPRGTYYVEIDTTGDPMFSPEMLSVAYFLKGPGATEARNVYGGDVNRNPTSPLHNLAYFGVAATNTSGTSGLEVVSADASTIVFPQDGVLGTYDYVSASVLSDETILLGGQAKKKLRNVKATDGTLLADYAVGKVDVRSMQSFGAGAAARTYFVDDQTPNGPLTGSIALLDPISNTTGSPIYQTIVSQTTIAADAGLTAGTIPGTRGLVVNRTETSLWLCGAQASASGVHFLLRYDKVGGVWQKSASFMPAVEQTARLTGLALSPDESVLYMTVADPNNAANSRIAAFDPATGTDLPDYSYYVNPSGTDFQPVGITASASDANHNAQTSYNLFVSGFRTVAAAVSTGNSIAVIAPKDNGSSDKTRSSFFDVTLGASAVSVTAGPTVSNITDSSATISWSTDFRSGSIVHFGGAAGTYNMPDATAPDVTTEHVVNLANLAPGVTYYFQVESKRDPLTPGTATGSFTTTPHLRVESETLNAGTGTSAALTVNTNVACDVLVHWGDSPSTFNKPDIAVAGGTAHVVNFTGLSAGATYYYQVVLSAANAIGFTSTTSAFTNAVAGGSDGSVTDNNLALGSAVGLMVSGGSVTLPRQGVPGTPGAGPALPASLYDAGVVAYNGYLYVIGGGDTTGVATTSVYYIKINTDGTLDSGGWQTGSNPLPAARSQIAGMVVGYNGRIYVAGGLDGSSPAVAQASVLYAAQNPATGDLGPWQGLDTGGAAVNPFPATKYRGTASVMDGCLLVSGGMLGGVPQATNYAAAFKPDGSLGSWYDAGSLNDARFMQRAVANDHKVFSIGGQNINAMPVGTVDFAFTQPNSNLASFTHATSYPGHADSKFDLSTGRRGVAAAFVAGKFVTAGGQLRDVQNGDLNGTKLISYARIADDGIPQTWVDASTVDSGAVLTNNLVDVDGAAWNSTLYIPGGRATSAFGTGADGASTAYSDVLVVPMNADPNDTGFATSGTLESRIIDLGGLTNVKHITVSGSLLSSIDVRYRLGNADGVWSDWFTASSADADITGGARYFQYSIVLRGGSSTPAVTSVTITTAKGGVVPFTTDDVKRALQLAAGLDKASSADMARLDVDGAAGITAGDAVKIQRALNGK